jgi:hypothetical protein
MVHKTDNWKEALLKVRQGLNETKEPIVELSADEVINEEIDALILLLDEDTTEEIVEVSDKEVETEERSVEKLLEKNMLGRLAKSMELNEDNKQKLFDYFESGELEQ